MVDNDLMLIDIVKAIGKKGDNKTALLYINRLAALPQQIKLVKSLVSALDEAVTLERKIFKIDDGDDDKDDILRDFIKSISGNSLPIKSGSKK